MTDQTEDNPISECFMTLLEGIKANRVEIEGLKKMMNLVVEGMDKGLPGKTGDDKGISYYNGKVVLK